MTLREELTALLGHLYQVDEGGVRHYTGMLPTFPPSYKPIKVHYEMTFDAARLVVFLCNNAEAIRDALP